MPVAMTTSSESTPERTELSAQELPAIPTVQEMKTWATEKVLRWIQQRDPNILEEDDLDNFKKARITGRSFLVFDVESFKACGLPLAVAASLKDLVDEVKEGGKFIPTDVTQTSANCVKGKLSNQTAGRKRKGKISSM
jgi:hypothetical protein